MIWECHYCGKAVYNDEIGYNFFMNKYYCNPTCAEKDGIDLDKEYDSYGDLIKK